MSAARAGQPDVPLTHLTLQLRPGASLCFRQCWPAALPAPGCEYLPLKTIEQALREALPLGLRVVRLSGSAAPRGDALLHPEIAALLDKLESLELRVEVETGGAGLTPQLAARLARLPQCAVIIGLDGASAPAHDALHLPGAFEIAAEAAQRLSAQGLAPEIVFSVRRATARQVPAAVRLAGDLGAKLVRFVPLRPVNGGCAPDHRPQAGGPNGSRPAAASPSPAPTRAPGDYLRVEELIALGRKIEREYARSARIPLVFEQPPAFRGLHAPTPVERHGRGDLRTSLSLLPGGWYALCGAAALSQAPGAARRGAAPELILGKAGADSLGRIWREHPTLLMLRENMADMLEGVCERCLLKRACLGYCPVENYLRTGNFWAPHWFCAEAELAGLFPASLLIENTW